MQPRFKRTTGLEEKWSRVKIREEEEIMNTDNQLLNKYWLALSYILSRALSQNLLKFPLMTVMHLEYQSENTAG